MPAVLWTPNSPGDGVSPSQARRPHRHTTITFAVSKYGLRWRGSRTARTIGEVSARLRGEPLHRSKPNFSKLRSGLPRIRLRRIQAGQEISATSRLGKDVVTD